MIQISASERIVIHAFTSSNPTDEYQHHLVSCISATGISEEIETLDGMIEVSELLGDSENANLLKEMRTAAVKRLAELKTQTTGTEHPKSPEQNNS